MDVSLEFAANTSKGTSCQIEPTARDLWQPKVHDTIHLLILAHRDKPLHINPTGELTKDPYTSSPKATNTCQTNGILSRSRLIKFHKRQQIPCPKEFTTYITDPQPGQHHFPKITTTNYHSIQPSMSKCISVHSKRQEKQRMINKECINRTRPGVIGAETTISDPHNSVGNCNIRRNVEHVNENQGTHHNDITYNT